MSTIQEAINLIQDARIRALVGEYGLQDVEYPDVKERFDRAIQILQNVIEDRGEPITKSR